MAIVPGQVDPALGPVLRAMREARSQTQEDLAHYAKITVAALARIERGESNPRWATVRSIIAALEVELIDLGRAVEDADD
jgi:transcriptional regulator with XRE-family HTH domain